MKFQLDVRGRILLLNLLRSSQGDIILMKLIKRVTEDVSFSKEELTGYGFKYNAETGETHWDEGLADKKEIDIDELIVNLIKSRLRELNKGGKIGLDHIDLWDMFVGE